jgi:hypothetical protein
MNYTKSETKHSLRRAEERYGADLSKRDIAEIVKIIMSPNRNNKVFLHQQDDGCSHWLVRYRDKRYRVVFDEHTRTTRTFLAFEPLHEKLWRDTHDEDGRPTLGDIARIERMKLK